jgi:DNA-binding transcriptional LysR family regulator
MNLNETLAFVAVARTGSFTAAGEKLGLPKATISRRLARLERRLEARLMERTTRRLRLTDVGRAYYERCAHAIEAIEDAERAASDVSGRASGTLRVSAPFDLARDRLAGLLPELHRRHPELKIVFELTQRHVDLVAEGFDVALRGGPKLEDTSLIARKLLPSALVLVAAPRYLKRRGTPASVAELAGHDLVALGGASTPPRRHLSGPDGPVNVAFSAWLVANELGVLRTAVLGGAGIGLLERNAVEADLRARRLRRVLPEYGVPGAALWAVYPSSHHLTPKVRLFIDLVADHLAGRSASPRPHGR